MTNVLRRGQDPGDRRVATPRGRAADQPTDPQSEPADPPDVDPAKTIMVLRLQQTAYQAALAATAGVVQASLLDFLR